MQLRSILVATLLSSAALLPAHAQITSGTQAPTAAAQTSLDLINRFRADPQGELARILGVTQASLASIVPSNAAYTAANAGPGTVWSNNFWSTLSPGNAAASAMDSFQVKPGDLIFQWSALPAAGTLAPYIWNGHLGQSSQGYAQIVVADNNTASNPHYISPYTSFDFQRFSDAGYANAGNIGENIARGFANDVNYMHAGFAIDWGGTGGIQQPSGHRNSMLSDVFTEAGIGIAKGPGTGLVTQVQHFGDRFNTASEFVWGYVYQDASGGSYTFGEGLQGVTVNILDASNAIVGSVLSDANGGYIIDATLITNGNYTVQFMNGTTQLGTQAVTLNDGGMHQAGFAASASPIPEPATWLMMLAAGAPLLRRMRARTH